MKKALQMKHLRARGSVSDRPVGRVANKRRFYDFRDRFAEVSILDGRGHLFGLAHVLGGRRGRHSGRLFGRIVG
jgi:hypothetical protein